MWMWMQPRPHCLVVRHSLCTLCPRGCAMGAERTQTTPREKEDIKRCAQEPICTGLSTRRPAAAPQAPCGDSSAERLAVDYQHAAPSARNTLYTYLARLAVLSVLSIRRILAPDCGARAVVATLEALWVLLLRRIVWNHPGGDPAAIGAVGLALACRSCRGRLESGDELGEECSPSGSKRFRLVPGCDDHARQKERERAREGHTAREREREREREMRASGAAFARGAPRQK